MVERVLIRCLIEDSSLDAPSTALHGVYPELVEGLRVSGNAPLMLSVAATAAESKHPAVDKRHMESV